MVARRTGCEEDYDGCSQEGEEVQIEKEGQEGRFEEGVAAPDLLGADPECQRGTDGRPGREVGRRFAVDLAEGGIDVPHGGVYASRELELPPVPDELSWEGDS